MRKQRLRTPAIVYVYRQSWNAYDPIKSLSSRKNESKLPYTIYTGRSKTPAWTWYPTAWDPVASIGSTYSRVAQSGKETNDRRNAIGRALSARLFLTRCGYFWIQQETVLRLRDKMVLNDIFAFVWGLFVWEYGMDQKNMVWVKKWNIWSKTTMCKFVLRL